MIQKSLVALFLTFLTFSAQSAGVKTELRNHLISIRNERLKIEFDLASGLYNAINLATNDTSICRASFSIDQFVSTDANRTFTWNSHPVSEFSLVGQQLRLCGSAKNLPDIFLDISLYDGVRFAVLRSGIKNTTSEYVKVHKISPLFQGDVFKAKDKSDHLRILDGNAGGEPTKVDQNPPVLCRNNILLTFGQNETRNSLVAGGLTYTDYEKFVELDSSDSRRHQIEYQTPAGMKFLAYMNLPIRREDGVDPMINLALGDAHEFKSAPEYEMKNLVYDSKQIIINLLQPRSNQSYCVGLSWCSDNSFRKQSVWADNGPGTAEMELAPSSGVPNYLKGEGMAQVLVNIPDELLKNGNLRLLVKKEGDSNAVLNEVWLYEGQVESEISGKPQLVMFAKLDPNKVKLNLTAQDPVGKRVDKDSTFFPEDRFYLDFITSDPFQSLENYGLYLKMAQKVKLAYYDFPSVCLWYAMHPFYGNGPGMNNSVGAVEEMDRIVASGFLKYSKVAVRLVPDCYEDNNEQGWWDDKHFQMHGSGNAVPGEVSVDVHYKAPFETTAKWAQAIVDKGGIPLLYVQTGKRSQDYADTYPTQMLFNQSNAYVPDFSWTVKGKGGYDFTDTDFTRHMQDVYANFRKGGLKGLMFDYTNTGWAWYGGMDDSYSTATAAYRKIFSLAREGMGDDAYIHERCLERGSDMTLGLVSSQRIWGDTDDVTPEMVSRGGSRWYKNRVVVSYDMDAKNLLKAKPADNPDGRRKLLTMAYVASGRLLLANSFARFDKAILHDLSRVFPFHTAAQSARPVDLFTSEFPSIYDFKVSNAWHQLTFYNTDNEKSSTISVEMDKASAEGGLGLERQKAYYIYDFWNDTLIGKIKGNELLIQTLRPGEARMMSVREAIHEPQVLSTNRHIMQGYLDLKNLVFDQNQLSGASLVPKDEPYEMVIALNGKKPLSVSAENGLATFIQTGTNQAKLILRTDQPNQWVKWKLLFN